MKRKKRLVVMMALDSHIDLYANDASYTEALRQYLRQYTYIDCAAGDWLDKLLYALPLHGMGRDECTEPELFDADDVVLLSSSSCHHLLMT